MGSLRQLGRYTYSGGSISENHLRNSYKDIECMQYNLEIENSHPLDLEISSIHSSHPTRNLDHIIYIAKCSLQKYVVCNVDFLQDNTRSLLKCNKACNLHNHHYRIELSSQCLLKYLMLCSIMDPKMPNLCLLAEVFYRISVKMPLQQ